eukprot:XP_791645.3 PREDICTED: protein EMSY [Strongylocentrotus purpuratus]
MWPRLLDMEEKECRSVLRRLELEAYSSVISAFRAQGDLTPEKKSLLRSVASTLSISTERHKAEVRRAVNDEKLTTIAERVGGENNSLEWSVEGRRLVPLMPRFIPQTAYTMTANQMANMAHAHNATLPDPEETARKDGDESRTSSDGSGESNYIVLPPGTILPKSSLDLQQLDEQAKQRHLSSSSACSFTSSPASFLSALTSGKLSSQSSSSSEGRSKGRSTSGSSTAPSTMKITFTKVGSGTTPTTSQAAQKQVIIMSSANADQSPPSEVPSRSQGLPASTKVTMATMSEGHPPFQMSYEDQLTGVVTPYPPVSKHHRKGSKHKSSKPFTIIQQTPGPGVSTLTSSAFSTQVTGSGSGAPPMVMGGGKRAGMVPQKPEPGMKLITQTVASSSGRMSSKTYQVSASSATPSVRTTTIGVQAPRSSVTTGSQSTSLGLGARNIVTSPGPRIVTVPSQMGGRPQCSTSNVITLSPMSLQKTTGKNTATVVVTKPNSMMPGKTNVIVVQKSQIKSKMISSPRSAAPGIMTHTTSVLTRPKIAMTMTGGLGGSGSPNPPSSPGTMGMQSIRFPSPPTSAHQKTVRGPSPVSMGAVMGGVTGRGQSAGQGGLGSMGKSQGLLRSKSPIAQSMAMLSADLELHTKAKGHRRSSAGSLGQGSSKVVVEEVPSGVMRSASLGRDPSLIFQSSVGKPNTEWIDYDGSPPSSQSASSAIKALLEIRGQPLPPTTAVKHVPFSGVSPGLPPSSTHKQSTITRRIPSSSSVSISEHPKEPSQSPTVITVDPKPAASASERLEFSSDQLSSVVDQFEQFLESEALGGGTLGRGKRLSGGEPETKPSEPSDQKEKEGEESSKIDPFEFVEEIISKDTEPMVSAKPKLSYGQEIPKTPVMDKSQVIGHKITPQVTPVVAQPTQPTETASVTSVVMESASSFDITQMNLEDLSCQRMREDEDDEEEDGDDDKRGDDLGSSGEMMSFMDTGSGGSGSEGVMGADGKLRVSRRKRKAPTPIDEETGPSSMPSWARAAWNLLQRVMRFRGANRPKGGINAASWFTRPVDPAEAPGYHKVIKKPMDFGTIKRNLEAATYQDFAEFHHNMMLVRGNCLQYNPPGHAARRDCEEVFQFYSSEYSKTLDRWQKQMLSMPKSPKRIRTDPSVLQPGLQPGLQPPTQQ